MKNLFYLVVLLIAISCSVDTRTGDTILIKGKVVYPNNDFIFLELLTPNGYEKIDSTRLDKKQSFFLDAPSNHGDIYRINFFNRQKNNIVLNNQDVYIEADGNSEIGGFFGKGSEQMGAISEVHKLKKSHWIDENLLNQQTRTAISKNEEAKLDSLQQQYMLLKKQLQENIIKSVRSLNGNLTALFLLYDNFEIEPNLSLYHEQIPIMKDQISEHWYFTEISKVYNKIHTVAVGSIAPNFMLSDPDGNSIQLSSFQGKYLFLDFWASWCQPCRMENPDFVKVYNKFKGSDFEIFGVSFDKRKDRWMEAIEKDGLTWPHVSDLKYLDSEMVDLYNITSVPTTFLLDPNGKILAKNIHADELEKMLTELL